MSPGVARRAAGMAVGAVLVALAAHGAIWWWVTGEIERHALVNLAAPPLPGWQATSMPPRRGGWPLAATVALPGVAAVSPGTASDRIRWGAEELTVSIALARPRTLVLAVHGAQSVQFGAGAPIPVTAALMRAEVPLLPDTPARMVAIEAAGLAATPPGGLVAVEHLDLKLEMRPAAPQGETAAALALAARRIDLPPGQPWPLGPRMDSLALDIAISGPVVREGDLPARAAAWRDGGGAITLRRLDLAWGDVTLGGGATLALDARLQPMGAATARIAGHDAALRALTAAGLLPQRSAVAAGAVLSLMARPPAEGGRAVVEVPLTLQDRMLSLGRIPLLRLPELVWRLPP